MSKLDERADDRRREKVVGRLLVLAAAVMWSTSGLFAHAPTFTDWPPEVRGPLLAFWRAAFACVALLPLVRRPRWSPKLIPMVVFFTAMNISFLTAFTYTEAAKVVWLQYTAPMWVFLVSVFWLRESVERREWLMLAFGMLGVGVILLNEYVAAPNDDAWQAGAFLGAMFGLLAGVTFAGVVLSLRSLRDQSAIWLIALNHLTTAIVLLPYAIYQNVWPQGEQWLYLAGFGLLQMGIPYVLFAFGVRSISGHEASFIVLLEPVLVPLWVFIAWHNAESYQAPRWWTLVGGGLILIGLIVRYAQSRRRTVNETG